MAIQFSVDVRNARLDAIESAIGTSPLLKLFSGTAPANAGAALSGNTLLASGALPADWLAAAASGSKSKNGTWTLTGQSGAGAGTNATFFRLYNSGDTVCHIQGSVTGSGGGGDMTMDNVSVANGQTVTVNTFTLTDANA